MNKKICKSTVDGMHCDSCELYIASELKKLKGVSQIKADSASQTVTFEVEDGVDVLLLQQQMNTVISDRGYTMKDYSVHQVKKSLSVYVLPALFALLLSIIFYTLQQLNVAKYFNAVELTYGAIFFLGIVASLTTCMAVVGGLALSLSSRMAKEHKLRAVTAFHVSRILGFVLLGGITALLGKVIIITGVVSQILKIVVALSMVLVAFDMLDIRLPKMVFPKAIAENLSLFEDKEGTIQAFMLGVATYFLPCAFTQSMQLYALSSGSFLKGAMIMGAFVLGTAPALLLVSGSSAAVISRLRTKKVMYTMGFLVLFFALFIAYEVLQFLLP